MKTKEKILNILSEEGIKKGKIHLDPENDEIIDVEIGPVTFQIYIYDEDDITYSIKSISGCEYDESFLNNYDQTGSVDIIYEMIASDYSHLKTIWKALERLEDKYDDEFFDIINSKYF